VRFRPASSAPPVSSPPNSGSVATASNLLRAMETSGLITRRASAENRRGVDVRASDLALGLFERFDRASERVLADVLSLLPTDDRAALVAALPALERLRDAAST